MQTHHLGYPRTGSNREFKKAFGNNLGKTPTKGVVSKNRNTSLMNYRLPQEAVPYLIPFYDYPINNLMLDVPLFYVRIA